MAGIKDDRELGILAEEVAGRVGLSFAESRRSQIAAAVGRVMLERGVDDKDDFLRRLSREKQLADDVIVAVTVGETHFFRGAGQTAFIRNEILPELRRRKSSISPIRICSIGCATGEEPYSIAILCDELGMSEDVRISAVDVSARALALAKRAEYDEWALRNTAPPVRERYFTMSEGRFRLKDRIAEKVRFLRLNITSRWCSTLLGRADFDLVLCRNVLLYLDPAAIEQSAARLFACLGEGGWLATAPMDPVLWKYAPFQTLTTEAGIIYRKPLQSQVGKAVETVADPGPPAAKNEVMVLPAQAAAQASVVPETAAGRAPAASCFSSGLRSGRAHEGKADGLLELALSLSLSLASGQPSALIHRREVLRARREMKGPRPGAEAPNP